jgi:hypothetical protein
LNWKLSKCNSAWFFKNYMCYHKICLSLILKPSELIFTEKAKNVTTNQMLNELGFGDSNTENKSNDSNDTVNDQDNEMSTGQVSEINEF